MKTYYDCGQLNEALETQNTNVKQLARKTNLAVNTIKSVLRGNCSKISTIVEVAESLNLEMETISFKKSSTGQSVAT